MQSLGRTGVRCIPVRYFYPRRPFPLLQSLVKRKEKRSILTTNGTAFLVRAVAATVAAAAGDRVRSTPAVVAPERTMSGGDSAAASNLPSTNSFWLVASVATRHHGVAELVRWQALSVVTPERSFRTFYDTDSLCSIIRESSGIRDSRHCQRSTYSVDCYSRTRPRLADSPVYRRTLALSTRKRRSYHI